MSDAKPKPTGLALLREPFPPNQIGKLPKPTTKDGKKADCKVCGGYHQLPAVHLDYVGHAALTDRLLESDPAWFWEPFGIDEGGLPRFDKSGGLWIRLTVCGMTRIGYGNADEKAYMGAGSREKEVIGDALRNAAMRFGAALNLWHKGDLHITPDADLPELLTQDEIDGLKARMDGAATRAAITEMMPEIFKVADDAKDKEAHTILRNYGLELLKKFPKEAA